MLSYIVSMILIQVVFGIVLMLLRYITVKGYLRRHKLKYVENDKTKIESLVDWIMTIFLFAIPIWGSFMCITMLFASDEELIRSIKKQGRIVDK